MRNKTILITGASSGIGKETAITLAQKGYYVFAAARRMTAMEELKKYGIHPVHLDLTDENSIVSCMEEIQKTHNVDILINNAGYGSYGALEDVPIAEARRQLEVNLFGLAKLTQLVLPYMRKQHAGKILNVSSIGGKFGEPHGTWYHVSKYGLEGLSDCLRMELKQFNIDVIVIQPGAIKTEWDSGATDSLIQTSGSSAYAKLAAKHVKMIDNSIRRFGSHPRVIATTIVKAIEARKPKTRYAAGGGASFALLLRKVLSDKMMDRFLLSQL